MSVTPIPPSPCPSRGRGRHRPPLLRLGRLGTLVLLASAAATVVFGIDVPYLSGRVVDNADLLPPDAEQRISTQLEKLERETGAQVVVLTVPTIDGNPLEDYSFKVAETWKLGRKDVRDGALFL